MRELRFGKVADIFKITKLMSGRENDSLPKPVFLTPVLCSQLTLSMSNSPPHAPLAAFTLGDFNSHLRPNSSPHSSL